MQIDLRFVFVLIAYQIGADAVSMRDMSTVIHVSDDTTVSPTAAAAGAMCLNMGRSIHGMRLALRRVHLRKVECA